METYRYFQHISAIILIFLFMVSGGKFSNMLSFSSFFVGCLMVDQVLSQRFTFSTRRLVMLFLVLIQSFQMTLWIKNLHNFMFIMMILGMYTLTFQGYWNFIKMERPSHTALLFYVISCICLLVFQHLLDNSVFIPLMSIIQAGAILVSYMFSSVAFKE